MANYSSLINQINQAIKTNGLQNITGQSLQTILDAIVTSVGANYQYAGVATPATTPGTPDQNVFYLAATAGTYTNFGGIVLTDGEVAVLKGSGSSWTKEVTGIATAAEVSQLGQEVNGKPLVPIDLSEYEEVHGYIWNGYYEKEGVYDYHRCKFVPIDEYRGREMELVAVQNPEAYSKFYVLKNIPDTSVSHSPVETPTGYENEIILTPSSPTYKFTVPQDAGCLCIYVMDTRTMRDLQPSSVSVLPLAPIFYSRQETDEKIAEELTGYYTKGEIDEKETITETETEELAPYSIAVGYVSIYQTVGNTVVFIEDTGYGNIYGFQVIPANSVVTVNFSAQTGAYGFALCDENDKVIEFCSNSGRESYTFARTSVKTKLYASSSKLDTAIRVTTSVETVKEAIARLDQEIDPKANRWTGKTIWWCGTSIPAGSDATIPGAEETIAGNYPTEVGNDLGATVINKAVGGSMCRANVRTGDYVGANFSNITSALTMTKAEIENFITNYATIKNVLTGNVPASLGAGDIARLRAASFEDRLLPYLNGTYDMPDLFVFDHGHNDFKYTLSGGGTDIGLQPTVANIGGELTADTYMTANNNEKLESFFGSLANIPSSKKNAFIASVNRNCFIGAVNFLVTLILHYNPHARIIFISNYEYENGDAPQYAPLIPAQDSIANSWAFPICRVYEYLGFSNHLIPGSMAWFNTTYPAQTPATTDITVYRAYLPDTVHPHSDITGDANNIYAGIISEFIKRIY